MIQAGTAAFETALNSVTSKNLPVVQASGGGAGIFDDTNTYNHELNYDLTGLTGNIDFLVGGSMRKNRIKFKRNYIFRSRWSYRVYRNGSLRSGSY